MVPVNLILFANLYATFRRQVFTLVDLVMQLVGHGSRLR
jgi:hypothetical protein